MPGMVSLHLDAVTLTRCSSLHAVCREFEVCGGLSLPETADPSAVSMWTAAGWERLYRGCPADTAAEPAAPEKTTLLRQWIVPNPPSDRADRCRWSAAADAVFLDPPCPATAPPAEREITRPVNIMALRRVTLSGLSATQASTLIDDTADRDTFSVLCLPEPADAAQESAAAAVLRAVLTRCRERGVTVLPSGEALRRERCTVRILREGFDGQHCLVHARLAVHDETMLITAQPLDVTGSDDFQPLMSAYSSDGGRHFSAFQSSDSFAASIEGRRRTCCSDMTPLWHRKTGRFLVTGHTVDYWLGESHPVSPLDRTRIIPYAVYDPAAGVFGPRRQVVMPDPVKYGDCGSGCSQCWEESDGTLLIPLSFREKRDGRVSGGRAAVMRASFDGETLSCQTIGPAVTVDSEVRGVGEGSVIGLDDRYYLTLRGDEHGYVCVSRDGLTYSEPTVWCWEDGTVVPSHNTQSHWFTYGGHLYLVYTRRNGRNDHVFRHRAPLYAAEVNLKTLTLRRETEFVVVPERGARLGNFGVCTDENGRVYVLAAEWMQPAGCEAYGSNNALWLALVKPTGEGSH